MFEYRQESGGRAAVRRGCVWKFGDDISGDDGIVRFSEVRNFGDDQDPAELARMCFAGLVDDFSSRVNAGDIVVAGQRFGMPSHPTAPMALVAAGIGAVVVESTDSAFIRRSLNAGLPVVVCPGITTVVQEGDELEVDLVAGRLTNASEGVEMSAKPFSAVMLDIVDTGGLVPYLARYLAGGDHA